MEEVNRVKLVKQSEAIEPQTKYMQRIYGVFPYFKICSSFLQKCFWGSLFNASLFYQYVSQHFKSVQILIICVPNFYIVCRAVFLCLKWKI